MRFTGTLTTWHDDRGFGFIEPEQGGQPLFVHIKAFAPGMGRPTVGQVLIFEVETGPDGRKRARAVGSPPRATVRAAPRRPRVEPPAAWTPARILALPVFAAVYAGVAWRWGTSPMVLLGIAGLSLVAFLAYVFDKSAAVAGRWRTSERTLHLLGLAGGWPGALVAQQLLRHKTRKPGFVAVFWCTVVLNVAALAAWHAGLLPGVAPPGGG